MAGANVRRWGPVSPEPRPTREWQAPTHGCCPWKKSSMYFSHSKNVYFVQVLRTRDRIMRFNTLCIHTYARGWRRGGRRKLEERWAAPAPATRLLPPPKPVPHHTGCALTTIK